MCYHAEFGCSMSKDVNTNRWKLKNWGLLGLHHLGMAWLTPRNMPLPTMCYLAKHGRSALQSVSMNRGEPPKLECWGSVTTGRGHG